MTIRDHIIQWARQNEPVSVNEIAEHVQRLFDRQAAAAKQGMNAAKEHGAHMEAEAKRLHAECNPEALESERAANAQLTEELEAARRDAEDWRQAASGMSADLTAIGQQHDALATFVNEAINACFDGCGIDGAWIHERGEELGLLEAVAYDPEIHHIDAYVPEPGETIYVRAAWLGTVTQGDDS